MAFVTIEDLYGQAEIIVFENAYIKAQRHLLEENIILIDGRLSIREDEDAKIVANRITEFKGVTYSNKSNAVTIDITNLSEERKDKLRGAIRFFSGDRNNCRIDIKNGERVDSAGGVIMNEQIFKEFEDIVGSGNIK